MVRQMAALLADPEAAAALARHGRETILRRHTCAHRADELMAIVGELRGSGQLTHHSLAEENS